MKLFQRAVIFGSIAAAALIPAITDAAQTNVATGSIKIISNVPSELYVKCGPTSPSKNAIPVLPYGTLGPLSYGLINTLYFGGGGTGVCGFYSDAGYSNLVGEATLNLNIAPSIAAIQLSNIAQGYSAIATANPSTGLLEVAIAGK